MSSVTPRQFVEFLLPPLVTAGHYSSQIQKRITPHPSKGGKTEFHQALSDADLTVQAYLEVVLLSRFPELSYYSEEMAQSLNAKYFAQNAEYEVLLDPIDGTRAYLDGRDFYQIVVTLHARTAISAALCYLPRLDCCYYAVAGEGAFMLSSAEMLRGAPGTRFQIPKVAANAPIVLFDHPEVSTKLSPGFQVTDIVTQHRSGNIKHLFTDLFLGKNSANIHAPVQLIDGGAMAFIAQMAGGVVTDFKGDPLGNYRANTDRSLPNVVAAANQEIHHRLIELLAK